MILACSYYIQQDHVDFFYIINDFLLYNARIALSGHNIN